MIKMKSRKIQNYGTLPTQIEEGDNSRIKIPYTIINNPDENKRQNFFWSSTRYISELLLGGRWQQVHGIRIRRNGGG